MTDQLVFLQQEIQSASPAKLRWMLLRRVNGLCEFIHEYWSRNDIANGLQWMLQVQDILSELLAGVTDSTNPISKPITDLYVYLIQQSHRIYASRDLKELAQMREVLAIEEGTWKAFVDQEIRQQMIQLATQKAEIARRVDATIDSIHAVIEDAETRPLNLEC